MSLFLRHIVYPAQAIVMADKKEVITMFISTIESKSVSLNITLYNHVATSPNSSITNSQN